jgi:hypothetical protein
MVDCSDTYVEGSAKTAPRPQGARGAVVWRVKPNCARALPEDTAAQLHSAFW